MVNSKLSISQSGQQPVFLGIDVHKNTWNLTLIQNDQIIGRATIPPSIEVLQKTIGKHYGSPIHSVYEAGFIGFFLHYELAAIGIHNIVVAPNKIPVIIGDKVKTDRRDSLKLATLLSKGMLNGINTPPQNQINNRQFLRTREQLTRDRRRTILQIKSLLIQYGISPSQPGMNKKAVAEIRSSILPGSIKSILESYFHLLECLNIQIKKLEQEAISSITKEEDRERFNIIYSTPGIGKLSAAILVHEIGDWLRFQNEKQIAAYFGLTPSEYSSGDQIRRGRITGQGRDGLRALLIEASWTLIKKDDAMRKTFERIATQTKGKKKAIVAVARKLICRLYSMVKNKQEYRIHQAA